MTPKEKKLLIELDTDDWEKINKIQQTFDNGIVFFPKEVLKIYEIDEFNNLRRVY
jgi:hypothetical protein